MSYTFVAVEPENAVLSGIPDELRRCTNPGLYVTGKKSGSLSSSGWPAFMSLALQGAARGGERARPLPPAPAVPTA